MCAQKSTITWRPLAFNLELETSDYLNSHQSFTRQPTHTPTPIQAYANARTGMDQRLYRHTATPVQAALIFPIQVYSKTLFQGQRDSIGSFSIADQIVFMNAFYFVDIQSEPIIFKI